MGEAAYLPFVHGHIYRLHGRLFQAHKNPYGPEWALLGGTEEGDFCQPQSDDDSALTGYNHVNGPKGWGWYDLPFMRRVDLDLAGIGWVADSHDELRAQIQQEENRRFRAFMTEAGW